MQGIQILPLKASLTTSPDPSNISFAFPTDDGTLLLQKIYSANTLLYGASDASLKQGNCTHVGKLSTGNKDDAHKGFYSRVSFWAYVKVYQGFQHHITPYNLLFR
jgi:hypothetical protein